jgi:hypothetical protein
MLKRIPSCTCNSRFIEASGGGPKLENCTASKTTDSVGESELHNDHLLLLLLLRLLRRWECDLDLPSRPEPNVVVHSATLKKVYHAAAHNIHNLQLQKWLRSCCFFFNAENPTMPNLCLDLFESHTEELQRSPFIMVLVLNTKKLFIVNVSALRGNQRALEETN